MISPKFLENLQNELAQIDADGLYKENELLPLRRMRK